MQKYVMVQLKKAVNTYLV